MPQRGLNICERMDGGFRAIIAAKAGVSSKGLIRPPDSFLNIRADLQFQPDLRRRRFWQVASRSGTAATASAAIFTAQVRAFFD